MYIKHLKLYRKGKELRTICFNKGVNFIVDNTPNINKTTTGNNVGKTTVLKLIDFCLGASAKEIYIDPETPKKEYQLVKEFLFDKENEILVELLLKEDLLDDTSYEVKIERNFLAGKRTIRHINGKFSKEKEFEQDLCENIFNIKDLEKPTFNQIIAHNIRYKDNRISNTLKFLNSYTSSLEYQFLFLFMFGCNFHSANEKLKLVESLKVENSFKNKLEKEGSKNDFKFTLDILLKEINKLELKINEMDININFSELLENYNLTKNRIGTISSDLSKVNLRLTMINESLLELEKNDIKIDLDILKNLYEDSKLNINTLHKSFNEVVEYHKGMVYERKRFIGANIQELNNKKTLLESELRELLIENNKYSEQVHSFSNNYNINNLTKQLNEKYEKKGKLELQIKQLEDTENAILNIRKHINSIDLDLFSNEFIKVLDDKLKIFNDYFIKVSRFMYNEDYLISYQISTNKDGVKFYDFSIKNAESFSTGKKQGEVLCFDLAYIEFAIKNNIPTLNFIANDKKELLHENQMLQLKKYLINKDIQFICSIMKDKLPEELNDKKYISIELSQDNKLFKIENVT